jgi:hypothetical protein
MSVRTRNVLALAAPLCILSGVAWAATGGLAQAGLFPRPGDIYEDPDYTPAMQDWIDSHQSDAGVFVRTFGRTRLVMIALGQKPTSGYAVETELTIRPAAQGSVTAQVISYPYTVVALSNDGKPVSVFDITGGQPLALSLTIER